MNFTQFRPLRLKTRSISPLKHVNNELWSILDIIEVLWKRDCISGRHWHLPNKLTNRGTPWSTALQKLNIFFGYSRKSPCLHGTQYRFHKSPLMQLSWASRIQTTPLRPVFLKCVLYYTPICASFFLWVAHTRTSIQFSVIPYCHIPHSSHPPWFHHPNVIVVWKMFVCLYCIV